MRGVTFAKLPPPLTKKVTARRVVSLLTSKSSCTEQAGWLTRNPSIFLSLFSIMLVKNSRNFLTWHTRCNHPAAKGLRISPDFLTQNRVFLNVNRGVTP